MPEEIKDIFSPYILNDIAQIISAVGVIMAAWASISSRSKLDKVDQKVDTAVNVAADTRDEAVHTRRVTIQKIEEVKKDLQEAKVEAMQAIKINGSNGK